MEDGHFTVVMHVSAEHRTYLTDTLRTAASDLHRLADRWPLLSQDPNTQRYQMKKAAGAILDAVGRAEKVADDPSVFTAEALAELFEPYLVNTGGNSAVELLRGENNGMADPPVTVLASVVRSQVQLLGVLLHAGLLAVPGRTAPAQAEPLV